MRTNKTVEDFYPEIELAVTKAAPLFNLFGWKYGLSETDASGLEETITGLVKNVLEQYNRGEDECYCASGRFSVNYKAYENERYMTISLELSEHYEYKDWK